MSWLGPFVFFGLLIGLFFYLTSMIVTRQSPLPRADYSETNVHLWCEAAGLELRHLRRIGPSDERARFRFLVVDADGRNRAGWVISDRDQLDATSQRLNIQWRVLATLVHAPRLVQEDPLWDDGLDGGPYA